HEARGSDPPEVDLRPTEGLAWMTRLHPDPVARLTSDPSGAHMASLQGGPECAPDVKPFDGASPACGAAATAGGSGTRSASSLSARSIGPSRARWPRTTTGRLTGGYP